MLCVKEDQPSGFTFEVDMAYFGVVDGSAIVASGKRLRLHGVVLADLVVQPGAFADILGTVGGCVRNQGAAVAVHGVVGSVQDSGGVATSIHSHALVKSTS